MTEAQGQRVQDMDIDVHGTSAPERAALRGSHIPRWAWTLLFRLIVLAIVLGFWEFVSGRFVETVWISSPSLIARRLYLLHSNGNLYWHAEITLWQAFLGLSLGLVVGVGLGMILAAMPRFAEVIDPFFMGLYSLPRVALAPLFIIWFGIGLFSKVVMVFSLVFFIFVLNTMNGLREVDPDLVNMMRTMGASRLYIIRKVQLPSLVPWIFAALRISIGIALIGSVIGELLGANRGLGFYIEQSGGRLDTTGVFAGLFALMIVAVIVNEAVKAVEGIALGRGRRKVGNDV